MTTAPWTHVPSYEDDSVTVHQLLAKDAEGNEVTVCTTRTLQDAKLIERAVNMHAALVGALQSLLANSGECLGDHPNWVARIEDLLRQAKT